MTFMTAEFIAWRAELRRKLCKEENEDRARRGYKGPPQPESEFGPRIMMLRQILTEASSYEEAEQRYRRAIAPRA